MLWLHLAGLRWRPGVSKGVEAETVPGGLITDAKIFACLYLDEVPT